MQLKKQRKRLNFKRIIIILGIATLPIAIYVTYYAIISEKTLIPISVIVLITGAICENRRLGMSWKTTGYAILISFIMSFMSFLPGKGEHIYNFQNHIELWPYVFLLLFILEGVVTNQKKITARLNEGLTLVQSIIIVYRVIDYGFVENPSIFVKILMITGIGFVLYSLFNAFTKIKLTRNNRFVLSIWSSIIMILLAIDHIYNVYQSTPIEYASNILQGISLGLGYFLLGVCAVYIAQNIIMITGFIPGKGSNGRFLEDVKELKEDHIERYSDKQINIKLSILCCIFSGSFLFLNYYFNFLPRNTSIWIVFFICNSILHFYTNRETIAKNN